MKNAVTPDKRKPPLASRPSAQSRELYSSIITLLRSLHKAGHASCLEPGFAGELTRLYDLIHQWQASRLHDEKRSVTCARGCVQCCNHWVEDVYSFEAEIIAGYVIRRLPQRIGAILDTLHADAACMTALEEQTRPRLDLPGVREEMAREQWDEVDLLLATFFLQRRPCPFLDEAGSCVIYPVRPLTCRAYYSFSEAWRCSPDHAGDDDSPTFILDLGEDANTILDSLHFRHDRFDGDTSLRTMMVSCLQPVHDHGRNTA